MADDSASKVDPNAESGGPIVNSDGSKAHYRFEEGEDLCFSVFNTNYAVDGPVACKTVPSILSDVKESKSGSVLY